MFSVYLFNTWRLGLGAGPTDGMLAYDNMLLHAISYNIYDSWLSEDIMVSNTLTSIEAKH